MRLRISRAAGLGAALAALPLFPLGAAAQIAVSANDGKPVLVDGVVNITPNPAPDTVTIIDLGASPPKVLAEVRRRRASPDRRRTSQSRPTRRWRWSAPT